MQVQSYFHLTQNYYGRDRVMHRSLYLEGPRSLTRIYLLANRQSTTRRIDTWGLRLLSGWPVSFDKSGSTKDRVNP